MAGANRCNDNKITQRLDILKSLPKRLERKNLEKLSDLHTTIC